MQQITDAEEQIIEKSRTLARRLVAQLEAKGVQPADATIGLAYALHDAASELTGSHSGGLDWMRQAIAVMANQVEASDAGNATTH